MTNTARISQDDYWHVQKAVLGADSVNHVKYAEFVADHLADDLKYDPTLDVWYRWNGKVWECGGKKKTHAFEAITESARILSVRGGENPYDSEWTAKAVSRLWDNSFRSKVVNEMMNLSAFHVHMDTFNQRKHLLTFQNGTFNALTDELEPFDRENMLTQIANVDYVRDAPAPRWDAFMNEVHPDNPDLITYLHDLLGYALTGEIREHLFSVWFGRRGRNGKGTIIRTLSAIFGRDIVWEVPYEVFEKVPGRETHTETLASFRGPRIVIAQEGNPGAKMNTARLRSFSGGDDLPLRQNYKEQEMFTPNFTLILVTNHLPMIAEGGDAIWARVRAIEFTQHFTGDAIDPGLEPTLQGSEREGIAARLMAGMVRYYRQGLTEPKSVIEATAMHREEVDPLSPLRGTLYEESADGIVKRSEFNKALKRWKEDNDVSDKDLKQSKVQELLRDRGVVAKAVRGHGMCYLGIVLCVGVENVR